MPNKGKAAIQAVCKKTGSQTICECKVHCLSNSTDAKKANTYGEPYISESETQESNNRPKLASPGLSEVDRRLKERQEMNRDPRELARIVRETFDDMIPKQSSDPTAPTLVSPGLSQLHTLYQEAKERSRDRQRASGSFNDRLARPSFQGPSRRVPKTISDVAQYGHTRTTSDLGAIPEDPTTEEDDDENEKQPMRGRRRTKEM